MMDKQKILEGIDNHLVDIRSWKSDIESDETIPLSKKQETITELKVKYSNLLNFRSSLKELLIG